MAELPKSVSIEAPARLHLGFLDLGGGLGRKFGGLGLAVEEPVTRLELSMNAGTGLAAAGPDSDRGRAMLLALCEAHAVPANFRLRIDTAIPAHSGLGSGTQLALAIGRGFGLLAGLDLSASAIAAVLGRGGRSGIGIGTFERGGLVLDGGRGPQTGTPPLLAALAPPSSWRILLIYDRAMTGVHGSAEKAAFGALPPFPPEQAAHLCHIALLQALPAVVEDDLTAFGSAIGALQDVMGRYFGPMQGGAPYRSPAVAAALGWLKSQGVAGVGQTSWGPTGFAFFPDQNTATAMLAALRRAGAAGTLDFHITRPRNRGADIESVRRTQDAEKQRR